MTDKAGEFDVGGVRLARPFKLLRLGHFGVNATDPEAARDYIDYLNRKYGERYG